MSFRPHRCRPAVTLFSLAAVIMLGCGQTETHPNVTQSSDAGAPAEPAATGAAGAAGATSPQSSDDTLIVAGVLSLQAGACLAKADLAAPVLGQGTLDRVFASAYTATLLISGTPSERVVFRTVDVLLTDTMNNPLRDRYSVAVTGFADAATDAGPSATLITAELIPNAVAAALPSGNLLAKLRVSGQTSSGSAMASPELAFPIHVCDGCLVQYPDRARDPDASGPQYQCRVTVEPADAADPTPCALGIDFAFSCVHCSAEYPACLGPENNPSH